MTRLEEIMLDCCELSLEEVQQLRQFMDILEAKKKESRKLSLKECTIPFEGGNSATQTPAPS